MRRKTTQVKSNSLKLHNNWKIEWYYINRDRAAQSHRWIRSLTIGFDMSRAEGFTSRLDLFKKFHIEISIKKTKTS
jgi:hypothetical protein